MKLFGIVGKPLDRSLSPKIFNALFKKMGLPHRYLPFQVEKTHLKNLILCMKLVDVAGLNVTAPYKEAVLPFLERLDATARRSGAVNTIVRQKNRFVGFNTDGSGLLKALSERKGFHPKGKKVVLIGAGGAARGIAAGLAGAGAAHIAVLNRNRVRAGRAVSFLRSKFSRTGWSFLGLGQKGTRSLFSRADLLVQATPAPLLLPLESLPKSALVCDIVYQPLQTKLLRYARKLGLSTLDGLWMLAYQAQENMKLWTGIDIDPAWIRRKCQ